MPNTYYIQIFIEESGTLLSNGGKSKAGHMWFKIYTLDEYNNIIKNSIVDVGYARNGIVNNDEETYLGNPTCESQKLEISQEAYEKLKEFASREEGYAQSLGFGINDYNVLSNSCVDYVWKALEIAGYNEKQFEGKLVPMENSKKVQAIVPNTKSTIFNRKDLFHNFDTILYPSSFYFDFNASENNDNEAQVNPHSYPSQESFLSPNNINSHRVGEIHFSIQAIDEYTRTPINNAKLQLQNINVGQESITDTKGIASFEIKESEYLKPFRAKLISEYYEQYPILDRSIIPNAIRRREKPLELRFKKKLDNFAVQQVVLEPNEYRLTEANNEIISKNFYKVGNTFIFKASFDESKTKENEIKWAYKVMNFNEIQMLQQQDCKDKNPQST